MDKQSILPIIHPEPFYGNPADVPDRPVVFAGLEFKVPSSAVGNLPLFTRADASGRAPPSLNATCLCEAGSRHMIECTGTPCNKACKNGVIHCSVQIVQACVESQDTTTLLEDNRHLWKEKPSAAEIPLLSL